MRSIILIGIIFFNGIECFSQPQLLNDTTLYFNERWEMVCCKDSAVFYRIGKYNHGFYDGEVSDYWMDGSLQMTGSYLGNVRTGDFNWYYKNGKKAAFAIYYNDESDFVKGWDDKGNIICKNGNGVFTWYHSHNNTVSSTGAYKYGKRDGLWKYYNTEGRIIEEDNYKDGRFYVINCWDDDGLDRIVSDGNGKYERHFKNGKLKVSGEYKDGVREGEWIWYYWNGEVENKCFYNNGVREGESIRYYSNGEVSFKGFYKNGVLRGKAYWYYNDGRLLNERSYD